MKNFAKFLAKCAGLTSFTLRYYRVSGQAANETVRNTPNQMADAEKNKHWYPLKILMGKTKSRSVFLETRKKRQRVLMKLLKAQGFEN